MWKIFYLFNYRAFLITSSVYLLLLYCVFSSFTSLFIFSLDEDVLQQLLKSAVQYWTPLTQRCFFFNLFDYKLRVKLIPSYVSSYLPLQLVRWATSSPFQALFPAWCVPPTAEPARRDLVSVNVAAAFTGQAMMPTLLPAQVSFVGYLFTPLWEVFKGPHWSFVIYSDCENRDVQSGTRIHPLLSSLNNGNSIPPAEKKNLLSI